jgi:hypothetical protein
MVAFFTASDLHRRSTSGYKPIYHEATKYVSALVGHECLPQDRAAREANYRGALDYVNSFCDLGLEKADVDLFGLYFTALSDSHRFGSDPVMELVQGENPATHSLQAVCLKQRMFDDAAQTTPMQKATSILNQAGKHSKQGIQLQRLQHSQMTGLAVLMHDMGEVLGEFTTAVQRMNDKNLKEDPRAEQTIFRYILRMALVAQATGDRDGFLRRVNELKQQVKLEKEDGSAGGIPKSSEYLEQFLQPPITLSSEQESQFEKLAAIWDMAEGFHHPLHDVWEKQGINVGFVGQLTKSIDHVQGTRHLVRHARKGSIAEIPNYGADRIDIAHINQNRAVGNMRYCEAEAGPMFDKLKPGQIALESVARQQIASIYRTMSDLMDVSPPVALGYQLNAAHNAVVNPASPPAEPESPSMSEKKRAQGAMRGLYERAAVAALRGDFTPELVDNGKGVTRSQLLGIDGLTPTQQAELYGGKAPTQGRGAA